MPQPVPPERLPSPHRNKNPRRRVSDTLGRMVAPLAVLALFLVIAVGNVEINIGIHAQQQTWSDLLASRAFWSLVAAGVVLAVGLPWLSLSVGAMLTAIVALHVLWLGYITVPRPPLPTAFSLFTLLMVYMVHLAQRYAVNISQKQDVIDAIGHYIPAPLVARISRDPSASELRAESRELSVLFCDVHGFTRLAERLAPEELSQLMNELLTPLTRIVHEHGGTIDKYIGDALMAFWGAPEPNPHHAAGAISAALDIQEAAQTLRQQFRERGWPELTLGVGINTGITSVGNMGSQYRVAYTAMGDAVNIASRLEQLTRVYHTGIIVGEATRRAFKGISYRELGLLEIKGKQELERVYEPIDPRLDADSTVLVSTRQHNEALGCYYHRDWDGAARKFETLHHRHPEDPLYPYYLARIEHFREHPPPPQWQGEIRYTVE